MWIRTSLRVFKLEMNIVLGASRIVHSHNPKVTDKGVVYVVAVNCRVLCAVWFNYLV